MGATQFKQTIYTMLCLLALSHVLMLSFRSRENLPHVVNRSIFNLTRMFFRNISDHQASHRLLSV